MDLDNAKENIQPLACGRDFRYLEAALNTKTHQEILEERKQFEEAIQTYEGDDPLKPWFQYIQWIEQSYPSGGRESGLEEVLLKCITTFESDQRYYQDRRMIKLYIKYIDTQPNPQEFYQELYNQGIGTMVADLYICWAYYYDLCGNFKKADSIFRKGLSVRAQPYEELDEAHKHFGFTTSQRILYEDDEQAQEKYLISLHERRYALTSLRGKKKVGSIRTGAAVKACNPGKVQVEHAKVSSSSSSNVSVRVFEDQNACPNSTSISSPEENPINEASTSTSGIRSIIDSARKQENIREPGPWTKAKLHKSGTTISTTNRPLSFEILEDNSDPAQIPIPCEVNNYIKGIQLDKNHITHNVPQSEWKVPICLEAEAPPNACPMYNKIFAYPKPDHEYSPEEYHAYRWYNKNGITNNTTKRLDPVWANDISIGIRLYPNFAHKNLPQEEFKVERFLEDDCIKENGLKFAIKINEIYPENCNEEYQFEEILSKRIERGDRKLKFGPDSTILMEEEMDETQIITNVYGRKSIFPSRKSILPPRQSNVHHQAKPHIEQNTATNIEGVIQNSSADNELQIRSSVPSKTFQLVTTVNKDILSISTRESSNSTVQKQSQEITALKQSVHPSESSQISDIGKSKVSFMRPRNPHPDELSPPAIQHHKNDQIVKTAATLSINKRESSDSTVQKQSQEIIALKQSVHPSESSLISDIGKSKLSFIRPRHLQPNELSPPTSQHNKNDQIVKTPATLFINKRESSDISVQKQSQEITAFKQSVHPSDSSQISDKGKPKVSFIRPKNPHPDELSPPTIQHHKKDQIVKTPAPTIKKPRPFLIYEEETSENAVEVNRNKATNLPLQDFEQDFVFKTPAPTVVSKPKPFQIYEEEAEEERPTNSNNDVFKTPAPTVISKPIPFQIYEEEAEEERPTNSNNDVFKTPAPTVVSKPKPFQIYEEEAEEERPTNSNNDVFAANETCSTQTFNFFIKSQLVSTPKHARKSQTYFTPSNEIETNTPTVSPSESVAQVPLEQISPLSDSENGQAITLQPKQLSTIMEITESNAATGSTKSSIDTQMSSPEFDVEMIKISQPISITKGGSISTPLHMMPEVDNEAVTAAAIIEKSRLEQKENTVSFMMKSLKPFEEKTETIPKMILAPKQPPIEEDDLCDFFSKTPEKAKTVTTEKSQLEIFEIDDSMTIPTLPLLKDSFIDRSLKFQKQMMDFSKQKEFTLPKLPDNNNDDDHDDVKETKPLQKEELSPWTPASPTFLKKHIQSNSKQNEFFFPNVSDNITETNQIQEKSLTTNLYGANEEKSKRQTIIPGFEDFTLKPIVKDFDSFGDTGYYKKKSDIKIFENLSKVSSSRDLEISKDSNLHLKIGIGLDESKNKFMHPSTGAIKKTKNLDVSHRNISISKNNVSKKDESNSVLKLNQQKCPQEQQQQNSNENLTLNQSRKQSAVNEEGLNIEEQLLHSQMTANRSLIANKSHSSLAASSNISSSVNTTVKQIDYFEDNIRTDAFVPDLTGIKNSTWLPNHAPTTITTTITNNPNSCQIHEKSLHIKEEIEDSVWLRPSIDNIAPKKSILARFSEISKRQSIIGGNSQMPSVTAPTSTSIIIDHPKESSLPKSIENSKNLSNLSSRNLSSSKVKLVKHEEEFDNDEVFEDELGRSIYYANTPKTPNFSVQCWSDEDDDDGDDIIMQQGNFNNREINFEQTRQTIEEHLDCPAVNPFDSKLINAFLDQFDFYGHLEEVPTCSMVNRIPVLKKNDVIELGDSSFDVLKIVAKGGFGTIFCAKERNTDKLYAIKQQKPPSLWEYYICLELRSRLTNKDIASYFMDVEYAMIGQNSSLLISSFSKYGCLITVCNKIKRYTGRNMDEYIAMILTSQMLSILDNLHALNIIHADIKPDNFLLISKLQYGCNLPVLQLIDFGVAIDLALFPQGQTFNYCPKIINDFTCVEMRENRPWTFQTDLYGVAASIHVLLFGKYMDVEKRLSGWVHKSKIPRYFKKSTWDVIFNNLLNIRECKSMPNLQYLRTLLEEDIMSREKYLQDKINQFNNAIEEIIF